MGAVERGEKVVSIDMAKRIVSALGTDLSGFFCLNRGMNYVTAEMQGIRKIAAASRYR